MSARRHVVSVLMSCLGVAVVAAAEQTNVVRQDFAKDPGWDAHNNRLVAQPVPITRQDFGWSDTHHAGGKSRGEIGGRVQRSTTPAYYARVIEPRTLQDHLHASGRFSVTQDDSSSGVLIGWFNETSRGWRTPNSLAFRLDGNGAGRGYHVFFEYGTQHYLAGGGGAFEGERYQTTPTKPLQPDGSSHAWTLDYAPGGANGDGLIKFTLDDRAYEVALAPGHKADAAVFDRFGVWNAQTTGAGMDVYLDDLVIDGQAIDLDGDPAWEGLGNRAEFEDRVRRPFQDFGFAPTRKAGGKAAGEMGGVIWRDDKPAYYADRVGPLSFDDELVVTGTIAFHGQGSDSGVWLGWFNAADKRGRTKTESEQPPGDFLGILIEGPSRIGHYFRPGYRTSQREGRIAETGPVIHPDGTVHPFTLRYDPAAAKGGGRIEVTFDGETVSLDLRADDRKAGARFDRFGLFNVQEGGHFVEVYFDDLSYTAAPASAR